MSEQWVSVAGWPTHSMNLGDFRHEAYRALEAAGIPYGVVSLSNSALNVPRARFAEALELLRVLAAGLDEVSLDPGGIAGSN